MRMEHRVRKLAMVIVAFAALALGMSGAPAAQAASAVAAVVPPGCTTSSNFDVRSYDSSGTTVNPKAVHGTVKFGYTTSGASVGMTAASLIALDGHTYQVSVARWYNSAETQYVGGPGGPVTSNIYYNWDPGTITWWAFVSPYQPVLSLHGYDVNRPAVGFDYRPLPCP